MNRHAALKIIRCLSAILILGVVRPIHVPAQNRTQGLIDTLAQVGNKVVTARDLVERIALMPWPGKDHPGEADSARIRALQSIVGEQILALEAGAQGIGDDSTTLMHVKNVEKLMVRDELYREEVLPKIRLSEQEIRQGLRRSARRVTLLMLGRCSTEVQAQTIGVALNQGGSVDSILADPPGSTPLTLDTVVVVFGAIEKSQEDAAFSVSESVPGSMPVKTLGLGWVVFKFLGSETNPEYASHSMSERSENVIKIIRKRKEMEIGNRYSATLLSKQRGKADPGTFALFAKTIRDAFQADSALTVASNGYRLNVVVNIAEDSLRPHLKDVLVQIQGGSLTIGDILEGYRVSEFTIPSLQEPGFQQMLNASIRDIVAREFLSREAYRKKLERTESVRHDVALWSTSWRAQMLMGKMVRDVEVTNDEVLEYLRSSDSIIGRDYEVNVREILTDSLVRALSFMERIIAGEDMKALARNESKRTNWARHDGESGYFKITEFPEIGYRALDASVGTLLSPVNVAGGFSLFMVLGKRQVPGDTVVPYDSLKTVIRHDLLENKIQKRLNDFLASEAARYHVKFFYNKLKTVEIPSVNMVTKRFIGFGGSMLAAPSLYPLWMWVRESKGIEEVFP